MIETTGAFGFLSQEAWAVNGAYAAQKPFPHVVIDDAIMDADRLTEALSHWPAKDDPAWRQFQNKKRCARDVTQLHPTIAALLHEGNAPPFVRFLEAVTGIESLIPDPTFGGAGLHEVERGGSLGIHIDFNKAGGLFRRVNVMLYINENWLPEWNGALELRADPRSEVGRVLIQPTWNRLVIFESSERSWHGHPKKLACPPDRTRRAIAFYYYTREPPPDFRKDHSTVYIR